MALVGRRCRGVGRTCNAPGHWACNAYRQGAQGVEAAAGVSRCTRCTCCKSLHGGGGALQCNDSAPTPGRLLRHLVPLPGICRTASDPAWAHGGAVTRNPALVNHAESWRGGHISLGGCENTWPCGPVTPAPGCNCWPTNGLRRLPRPGSHRATVPPGTLTPARERSPRP